MQITKTTPKLDDIVIIVLTNLDSDDFASLMDYLEFPKNLLIICDPGSITEYDTSKLNIIPQTLNDTKELISNIASWQKKLKKRFVGIVGYDEEYHYRYSEAISGYFKLPYYTKTTINYTSNKYLQRTVLQDAGIRVPKFQLVDDKTKEYHIQFPNVLKMITGYANQYMYKNRNKKELNENLSKTREVNKIKKSDVIFSDHKSESFSFDPTNQFIVEEYIGGNEYSCDYIIMEDKSVKVLRVVRKFISKEYFPFFEAFYLYNPMQTQLDFKLSDLEKVCKNAADALGITFGVCMMDFKCYDAEIVIIETTVRPGMSTFVELMGHIYKTTSLNKLIRQKLNLTIDTDIPKTTGLVVYLTTKESGNLRSIDTSYIDKNSRSLGLIKTYHLYKKGETIKDVPPGINRPSLIGYSLLKDMDFEKAEKLIKLVQTKTIITLK